MNVPEFLQNLVMLGVNVELARYIDTKATPHHDYGICWGVGGFYKHGTVFLTPVPDSNSGAFLVHGRYGHLGFVRNEEDLTMLNFEEWNNYEAKGFTLDASWIPALLAHGCIKEQTTVSYVSAD